MHAYSQIASVIAVSAMVSLGARAQAPDASPMPFSAPPEALVKHVNIDKTTQTLRAYVGDRLYLETHVSTGKAGKRTPNGKYTVHEKERMHRSKLYHNAPMPFSVHLEGNYFIHGFKSVPGKPASHGCIRLPTDGENPAKQFYNWVEAGTPVNIYGKWQG